MAGVHLLTQFHPTGVSAGVSETTLEMKSKQTWKFPNVDVSQKSTDKIYCEWTDRQP